MARAAVNAACLCLSAAAFLLFVPLPALAAGVELIEKGGRIVEMRGLNDSTGCAFAEVTGVVGKVEKAAKGKVPEGFWFNSQYGESYVNLDDIAAKTRAKDRKKAVEGLAGLLKPGNTVDIGVHGCGASGSIEKLVWVRLANGASADKAADGGADGAATATISGTLSYPSDHIPEDIRVCAEDVTSGAQICTGKHIEGKKDTRYELKVPPGRYHVYAQHTDPSLDYPETQPMDYKAYYSDFVTCGLNVSCPSHQPIVVEAVAGKTAKAEPHDWYATNP